ncbi:MAG TPA: glycosyltransferase family 2 protein [Polyangiaceae bacterium]|nr:glycosyltransferase family 2 protein [Polyangiaceae bacterium]
MRLSVCITTRNRASSIGETLENILSQCPADVEVVVVDGASTDGTVAVVSGIAERYPQLRLICPNENSGLDADYDRALLEARGEYCWIFADDDLLMPGAVARVLEACRTKPLVIVTDASVHNKDFSLVEQERRMPASGQELYRGDETEKFFEDCIWHLTFIGVVIVERSFWMSRERARYYGQEFIHVGVLFQAPIPGEIRVIREPLVKIRNGVSNWLNRWFEVWMYKWPRLLWSFAWIDEAVRWRIVHPEPWHDLSRLLGARASGFYGWRQFRTLVVPRRARVTQLLPPLFVVALPRRSARYVRGSLTISGDALRRALKSARGLAGQITSANWRSALRK